jgi:hypothetical protein
MEYEYWVRLIESRLSNQRGVYRDLRKHLRHMPIEALRDLDLLLRTFDEDIRSAKRTVRMFPGGPKIKI